MAGQVLPPSGLAKEFENLVETFDLSFGLGAVLLECRRYLFGFCSLRHFRQGPQDLFSA
jgi:hypothetical protein